MAITIAVLASAQSKITDYSHSSYIPVIDGNVMIWNETRVVRHSTNLTENSHMRKLLDVDLQHTRGLLSILNIHHRLVRSLDFLGSALKVVAGPPDAADFEIIRFSESQLIESNNTHVIINTETQNQINRLTDTVNKILAAKQQDAVDTPHLYETLLARNRMLISEIENLMLTITLAKSKIINPSILNHNDLKIILPKCSQKFPWSA